MKVRYLGVRPRGTIRPRRMWAPGEILEVDEKIARELIESPDFTLVKRARSRRREKR